jgi:hypothetical protein
MFESHIGHMWLCTLLGIVGVVVAGVVAWLAPLAVGQILLVAGAGLFVLGVPACVVFAIWADSKRQTTKQNEPGELPRPLSEGSVAQWPKTDDLRKRA